MTENDALRILSLQPGCSAEQLRQAYLDLVKVWHPDRFQSDGRLTARAERELQDINKAYELLQSVIATPSPSSSHGSPATPSAPYAEAAVSSPTPKAHTTPSELPLVKTVATGIGLGLVIAAAAAAVVLMTTGGQGRISGEEPEIVTSPSIESNGSRRAAERPVATHARPQSGTELLVLRRSGGGSLVVNNASRRDAVVALTASRGYERAVYVRAGEQVTLANVASGTYLVQMMVGNDWAADRFTRDVAYQELEQPVEFVETSDGNTTEYTKLTVSLQPIVANMRGIRPTQPFRIAPR